MKQQRDLLQAEEASEVQAWLAAQTSLDDLGSHAFFYGPLCTPCTGHQGSRDVPSCSTDQAHQQVSEPGRSNCQRFGVDHDFLFFSPSLSLSHNLSFRGLASAPSGMMMRAPWRRSEPHSGSWLLGMCFNSEHLELRDCGEGARLLKIKFKDTMNKHQRISNTVFTVAKWVSRGLAAVLRTLRLVTGSNVATLLPEESMLCGAVGRRSMKKSRRHGARTWTPFKTLGGLS